MDFGFAAFTLILTSLLFMLAAVLIKGTTSGPVFFVQERVGRGAARSAATSSAP